MKTPCSYHSDPVVLRISLPPGTAPELATLIIQKAVEAYWSGRRHAEAAADFPRVMTRAEQAAHILDLVRDFCRSEAG